MITEAQQNFADRMNDFEPTVITPCNTCEHRITGLTCSAFPDGIPVEILENRNDHKKPYKGDHGIQWSRKK